MILSAQLQYSKMLLADLFDISTFNDQITNVILEFQPSKGKQGRPRLEESFDEQSDQGVRFYNSLHTFETIHYL